MNTNRVVFVVNLLQDVAILRPVIYLAANELGFETCILVTNAFLKRDKAERWQRELIEIANDTESPIYYFENEFQALHRLKNSNGLIIAASESHLEAHKQVHNLFRIVPSQYVKITLQHGFECVGFLQSRDQDLAHGREITFAADIICGWCNSERLTAVAHSQLHKLHITGPTSLLAVANTKQNSEIKVPSRLGRVGLVCENMHSPRLNVAGDFKSEFLEIFEKFCVALDNDGCQVTLRPHPGGQYVINNDVRLPPNVILENEPIYKVDLKEFAYGISAPSSILIDMIIAGIPTAVWQDKESVMDLNNYKNITRITTLEDWLYFVNDAVERPNYYLEKQRDFLIENGIITDKKKILNNFSSLLKSRSIRNIAIKRHIESLQVRRILFFAPGYIPTLQLSFLKPLSYDLSIGNIIIDVISEINLNAEFKGIKATELPAREWLRNRIDTFKPNAVIFCRWAGPHSSWLINYLKGIDISVIYHLDDDLLNIPKEIGREKWASHNKPERLASVKTMLDNADLVYCSTYPLMLSIKEYGSKVPLQTGKIYCSSNIIAKPAARRVKKIGYMGIGHEADLESVLPSIIKYLRRNPEVKFELFGTIPIPNELKEFGDRITLAPKIDNYQDFLNGLVQYQWDIGICPLIPIPFNFLKANTKWVEYTAAGIAVIASKGTIYDECCANGCGILASNEHEWYEALQYLTDNTQARLNMIREAQNKVLREYSPEQLRNQVIEIISACKKKREKIIFISNSYVPTLQLSFIKPLSNLVNTNEIELKFISEIDFKARCWETFGYSSPEEWITDVMSQYSPSLVIFCRYSGPHSKCLFENATKLKAATIYHIDDDLLGIPEEIGYEKYVNHNKQLRLDTIRYLLDQCDLVYCSTQKLQKHLLSIGVFRPIIVGDIYCSGQIINQAVNRNVQKIGYMGSLDHSHNLMNVVGALVRVLRKHPSINFEFFGTIPCPSEFSEFNERISLVPKIDNYEEFLQNFAERQWDIGICPLNPIHFNMMKANTKWVEYTSVGVAVVASKGTVYDECCADQCGLLASSEDEWFDAIDSLITHPQARFEQVIRAQRKLIDKYSIESLTEQVLSVFNQAHCLAHK